MPKRSLLAYCITLPTKCLSSVRFLLVTKMQLATLMHKQDVYDLEVRHRNDIRLQISPSNCEIGVHSCRCDAHLVCCPLIPRPVLWPWICGAVWLRYPSQVALEMLSTCFIHDENVSLGQRGNVVVCLSSRRQLGFFNKWIKWNRAQRFESPCQTYFFHFLSQLKVSCFHIILFA